LTQSTALTLACSLVNGHLDCYNTLLHSAQASIIKHIKHIKNFNGFRTLLPELFCNVTGGCRTDSALLLQLLHWLSILQKNIKIKFSSTITITTIDLVRHLQKERLRITMLRTIKTKNGNVLKMITRI